MASDAMTLDQQPEVEQEIVLGGYAALAESAWMGAAQASDVLELCRAGRRRLRQLVPAMPKIRLKGLMTREFSIAEATFVLMASFFFSAFLGAVRQVLFNVQFGAGSQAAAYYAAFRLPDTLFSLIAGGALSSAMIPILLTTRRDDGEQASLRLTNLVLNALLVAVAVMTVLGEIFTQPFVTHILAPGFHGKTSDLTVTLTRIMLLQPLILTVGSVATGLLNSRNQFLLTGASIASHNIGLIGGIIATGEHPAFGIYGPTVGILAGAVIQALILLPGLIGRDFRYKPALSFNDRRLREVIALLIPDGLAVGVAYTGFIVDTAFASRAPQIAALPAIHNAFLLVALPIALLGQAVGQSAFPRLAAHAAAQEWSEMGRAVLRALGAVVALAIPALLFLIFVGRPVIRVLFEHGKFGPSAASLTYQVLEAYAIALPAYVAAEVISRALIALRDTRTPLATNSFQLAGRAAILVFLLGPIGVLAIPVAFGIMAAAQVVAMGLVLALKMRRRMKLVPAPV